MDPPASIVRMERAFLKRGFTKTKKRENLPATIFQEN